MVVKLQVFKKSSPNAKVTLYLTKRDYIDHVTHVDPIEGVVLLDPNYVGARSVYVQLVLTFRFGREEDESMGYSFVKTMFLHTSQVYPPINDTKPSETQASLMTRLGNFAFPFVMEFPKLSSPSYVMMQGWEDEGTLMGMEVEAMTFVGTNEHDIHNRSSARLLIRRLMECPQRMLEAPAPHGAVAKSFLTCCGSVNINVSLTKPVYYPEEDIQVKIAINNTTSREIKRLKVKVVQLSTVPLFSANQVRDKTIMKVDDPIALSSETTFNRTYKVVAAVPPKMGTGQIFLQGKLKSDALDQLAASTILHQDVNMYDVFGIHVSYAIRVKAVLGALTGDAVVDVPFVLAVQP